MFPKMSQGKTTHLPDCVDIIKGAWAVVVQIQTDVEELVQVEQIAHGLEDEGADVTALLGEENTRSDVVQEFLQRD